MSLSCVFLKIKQILCKTFFCKRFRKRKIFRDIKIAHPFRVSHYEIAYTCLILLCSLTIIFDLRQTCSKSIFRRKGRRREITNISSHLIASLALDKNCIRERDSGNFPKFPSRLRKKDHSLGFFRLGEKVVNRDPNREGDEERERITGQFTLVATTNFVGISPFVPTTINYTEEFFFPIFFLLYREFSFSPPRSSAILSGNKQRWKPEV